MALIRIVSKTGFLLLLLFISNSENIKVDDTEKACSSADSTLEECSEGKDSTEVRDRYDGGDINTSEGAWRQSAAHKYLKGPNEAWNNLLETIQNQEKDYKEREQKLNRLPEGDCSLYDQLIDEDLLPFSQGITKHMIDVGLQRSESYENLAWGTLYQIRGGKLYREKNCKFPARCAGIEHFLTEIAKDIPDTEFIVNVSDWPQISSHFPDPIPVFSFSKSNDYADITYPAWTFWEGGPAIPVYPRGIGRWDLLRKSLIAASKKFSWEKKESKAFFRGSRTSSERDALVHLSRSHPDLADAQYTKNQAWKSEADTLHAPAAKEVELEDHCKFKYLFNYRGVAASFRFKHLFLCKSLVLHVGDEWIEFFYPALKPWVHYIPVHHQAKETELRDLIRFLKEHDELAKTIAENGFQFIKRHLKLKHVTCYWKTLLTKYSRLLKYSIQPREVMKRL